MYKDKDKQREANRQASQRRRDKGMTQGMTHEGMMPQGMTEPKRSYIGAVPETPDTTSPKRGKDIKCFEDLPPDVQQSIDMMSMVDGRMDQTIKANRTAIAIKYQYLLKPDETYSGFLDRLYSPEHIEHCRKVEKWASKDKQDNIEGGPSEKAKPPKGRAVALSTT